jgi:hypothetical protein
VLQGLLLLFILFSGSHAAFNVGNLLSRNVFPSNVDADCTPSVLFPLGSIHDKLDTWDYTTISSSMVLCASVWVTTLIFAGTSAFRYLGPLSIAPTGALLRYGISYRTKDGTFISNQVAVIVFCICELLNSLFPNSATTTLLIIQQGFCGNIWTPFIASLFKSNRSF